MSYKGKVIGLNGLHVKDEITLMDAEVSVIAEIKSVNSQRSESSRI